MATKTTDRLTLKDFATLAGVTVERCGKEWGGTWAYRSKDHPNAVYCGYRSETELYRRWAEETFGKHATGALITLLRDAKRSTKLDKARDKGIRVTTFDKLVSGK